MYAARLIALTSLIALLGVACAAAFENRRPIAPLEIPPRSAPAGQAFHVRADGDDNADGLTPDTAWASIDRVNAGSYGPGDRVLFRGGDTFTGTIHIVPEVATGAPEAPIIFGSYGTGRATLGGGDGAAVQIESVSGIRIENLRVSGNITTCLFGLEGAHGIHIINERGQANAGITIARVEVSGYCAGIATIATGVGALTAVKFEEVEAHDNLTAGVLLVASEPDSQGRYSLRDVTIVDSRFTGSPGVPAPDAGANITGGGVFVYRGDRVIVENNVAIDNGGKNGCAGGGAEGGGNSGIVVYGRDITIRGNEVARQRVAMNCPWQGGGIAVGGLRVLVERNYTHDNDGPAVTLDNDSGDATALVRHNVSLNDGALSNSEGALLIVGGDGGYQFVNNTVRAQRGPLLVAQGSDDRGYPRDIAVANNVFALRDGVFLVVDPTSVEGIHFLGNLYYDASSKYLIQWGDQAYTGIEPWSLALDQERTGGALAAIVADPLFCAEGADTLDHRPFSTLAPARPRPESSAREAGRPIPPPLIAGDGREFAGLPVPVGKPDVGAIDQSPSETCG